FGVASQHHQVLGVGVGLSGTRCVQPEAELGAKHRANPGLSGGLGQLDDAVETVVIGQADGLDAEPGGRGRQGRGCADPVEETERGVAVQLRPRRGVAFSCGVRNRGGGFVRRGWQLLLGPPSTAPGQLLLELAPWDHRVEEPHETLPEPRRTCVRILPCTPPTNPWAPARRSPPAISRPPTQLWRPSPTCSCAKAQRLAKSNRLPSFIRWRI